MIAVDGLDVVWLAMVLLGGLGDVLDGRDRRPMAAVVAISTAPSYVDEGPVA